MSARLFACYFVALAACSTLAFTQFGPDSADPSPFSSSELSFSQFDLPQPHPALPALYQARHRRKAPHLRLQVAQAN